MSVSSVSVHFYLRFVHFYFAFLFFFSFFVCLLFFSVLYLTISVDAVFDGKHDFLKLHDARGTSGRLLAGLRRGARVPYTCLCKGQRVDFIDRNGVESADNGVRDVFAC